MGRFTGKVAVVTGATKGLGAAAARQLAAEGASVVITGRSADFGEGVVMDIRDKGGTAQFVRADNSREDDVKNAIGETVSVFGGLDILVNNAAAGDALTEGKDRLWEDLTSENFDYVMRVGLYGAVWAIKYSLPHMLAVGGGAIVNISSIASKVSAAGPAYSCSKGALNALTYQVAGAHGQQGIRSNGIIVGMIPDSSSIESLYEAIRPILLRDHTLAPRLGLRSDFASLVAFLASDEAAYMNGSLVTLDGGNLVKAQMPSVEAMEVALTAAYPDFKAGG